MFGDERLQAMPTALVTVEVLGVVAGRDEVQHLLAGWSSVMARPGSLAWVTDRLAHGPDTSLPPGSDAGDLPSLRGHGRRASAIILAAIEALHECLPASDIATLAEYQIEAETAGSDPTTEWHRAFASARWADRIVAVPEHSHLAAHARTALEVVREVGVTVGAELRDFGYVPRGMGVSPRYEAELAWVYEAVHVARTAAEKSGWDRVPWRQLLDDMLAVPHA
jgi:hypothetical protein